MPEIKLQRPRFRRLVAIKAILPSLPDAGVLCQSMDERHFRNFLIDLGAQDRAPYAGGGLIG
jgi:hypothetical protein